MNPSSPAPRLPPATRRGRYEGTPGSRHPGIPLLLAVAGWLVLVVTAVTGPDAFRFIAVFGFALICPGAAVVRLLPLQGFWERAVLSVAVGMSLAALAAEALAIGHLLSPYYLLVVLASLCTAAAVADLAQGAKPR